MKKLHNVFITICLAILLVACGSTSNLRSNAVSKNGEVAKINLEKYDTISVLDFNMGAVANGPKVDKKAGKTFANLIAKKLREKKAFKKVTRKPVKERSLILKGDITKYNHGNAALKLLVGFAGQSEFDADVLLTNNRDKKKMGQINVDQNSWVLAGGFAVAQTPEVLMNMAANRIAGELTRHKLGLEASETRSDYPKKR